jgi:hypothetical protein
MPSGVTSSVASVIGSLKRRRPAPGFKVKNPTDRMDLRHVGMPRDDDVDSGGGIDLQRLQVVQNVDRSSRQAHAFRVGISARPFAAVDVSADGGYVSLFALAKQRGLHHLAMKKLLEDDGVEPALDPRKIGATLYR